jgi:hypothetical protein
MSRERFERKLLETLTFLDVSAKAYDAGIECEALRMAVCLRILFHDTKNSTSLATHLGATWKILTTDGGHNKPIGYVNILINLGSTQPVRAKPKLGNAFSNEPLGIHRWWKEQVVFDHEGKSYMRSHIALAAANQDGGAHVDKNVKSFYSALACSLPLAINTSNLEYPNGRCPFDQTKVQQAENAHFALLRQFAHEILVSSNHFKWLITGSTYGVDSIS